MNEFEQFFQERHIAKATFIEKNENGVKTSMIVIPGGRCIYLFDIDYQRQPGETMRTITAKTEADEAVVITTYLDLERGEYDIVSISIDDVMVYDIRH